MQLLQKSRFRLVRVFDVVEVQMALCIVPRTSSRCNLKQVDSFLQQRLRVLRLPHLTRIIEQLCMHTHHVRQRIPLLKQPSIKG